MGKKKIAAMVVAVVAVVASYNIYNSQNTNTLSNLALANVEALANDEGTAPCKGYGSVLCTYNNVWVYSQN